jgi:ferritin
LGYHDDDLTKLELLLESLIKMVGIANKNVDSLQTRVSQLEWFIREQQQEIKEHSPIQIYSRYPHKPSEKYPLHL